MRYFRDLRPLYIAWLAAAAMGELGDDDLEPLVPPGLRELSAAQKALAEFMRVNEDLLATAAEASPAAAVQEDGLAEWIAALPEAEKNDLLTRMCDGRDSQGIGSLRRRFQASRRATNRRPTRNPAAPSAHCFHGTQVIDKREQAESERRALENARQEAAAAKARLSICRAWPAATAAWREEDALIGRRSPKSTTRRSASWSISGTWPPRRTTHPDTVPA